MVAIFAAARTAAPLSELNEPKAATNFATSGFCWVSWVAARLGAPPIRSVTVLTETFAGSRLKAPSATLRS